MNNVMDEILTEEGLDSFLRDIGLLQF